MRSITVARRRSIAAAVAATALTGVVGTTAAAEAAVKVSGAQVKRSSLPGDRVKPNSLTGRQINESRLGLVPLASFSKLSELAKAADTAKVADSAKVAETARTAESARTAETAGTAQTAQDAQKLNGRDHTAFLSNTVRVAVADSPLVSDGTGETIDVSCGPDEKAIGGGAAWIVPGTGAPTEFEAPITASMPTPATPGVNEMTGWKAAGRNLSGVNRILRVYATCVPKSA